jgi:hypothetical protein
MSTRLAAAAIAVDAAAAAVPFLSTAALAAAAVSVINDDLDAVVEGLRYGKRSEKGMGERSVRGGYGREGYGREVYVCKRCVGVGVYYTNRCTLHESLNTTLIIEHHGHYMAPFQRGPPS